MVLPRCVAASAQQTGRAHLLFPSYVRLFHEGLRAADQLLCSPPASPVACLSASPSVVKDGRGGSGGGKGAQLESEMVQIMIKKSTKRFAQICSFALRVRFNGFVTCLSVDVGVGKFLDICVCTSPCRGSPSLFLSSPFWFLFLLPCLDGDDFFLPQRRMGQKGRKRLAWGTRERERHES